LPHDTAETHANLLPFHLLVDKIRYAAAIRLATLPATHPLYKPVRDAAANLVKTHPTPLHDLMHRYNITPKKMETIDAVRKGPKWKSKAKIKIHRSKEEAVEDERMREGDRIRVYSDGSGIDGKIGAGAVLYRAGRLKSALRYQLGSATRHTVYEGEGVGLVLGMELIRKEVNVRKTSIGIDNQSGITAVISILYYFDQVFTGCDL